MTQALREPAGPPRDIMVIKCSTKAAQAFVRGLADSVVVVGQRSRRVNIQRYDRMRSEPVFSSPSGHSISSLRPGALESTCLDILRAPACDLYHPAGFSSML
jgi:hypothetical protein